MDLRNRGNRRNNPVTKTFTFQGKKGVFQYYDKKEEDNIDVDSLKVMVLSVKACIRGWSDANDSGIYSNYIDPYKSQEIVVKAKKNVLAKGVYSEIKEDIKAKGGLYTKVLFCNMSTLDGTPQLVKIELNRSALAAFNEFCDEQGESNIFGCWLQFSKGEERKKGSNKWFIPQVEIQECSKGDLEQAYGLLDNVLNPYLDKPSEDKDDSGSKSQLGSKVDTAKSRPLPDESEEEEEVQAVKDDLPF